MNPSPAATPGPAPSSDAREDNARERNARRTEGKQEDVLPGAGQAGGTKPDPTEIHALARAQGRFPAAIEAWDLSLLFHAKHARLPAWVRRGVWLLTWIGSGWTWAVIAVVLFFSGHDALAFPVLLGFLVQNGVQQVIKQSVRRPRPFKAYPAHFTALDRSSGGFSFPSGHTMQGLVYFTLFFHAVGLSWVGVVLGVACGSLVAVTRVMLQVHYPSDVVAGLAVGGLVVGLALVLQPVGAPVYAFLSETRASLLGV